MENNLKNKLNFALKLFIFMLLALTSLHAHAEYYLVYSTPDNYDLCANCQPPPHHKTSHRKSRHGHHHYHRKTGLSVYYPVALSCPCNSVWTLDFCACCPHPNRVRSQWGDYVVFSSRPADRRYGLTEEDEGGYNPDFSTSDDGYADLEVN